MVKIVVVEAVRKVEIPRRFAGFPSGVGTPLFGVSTERLFHSFGAGRSFLQKTSRQDGLETTITGSVDPQHVLFFLLQPPYTFLSFRCLRIDSPRSSMRWALCTKRSRMASASVGSPICSCQRDTGSCEVRIIERAW